MSDLPLAGIGVLVTRPEQQAGALVNLIEQRGGKAICFPTIRIIARDTADVAAEARELASPDIAIFVSSNAVQYGLHYADDARIAAIGPATADAVEAAGRAVDILAATGFDSEHLLATAELADVSGKTVRIIRGHDGRELLASTLRQRGAQVDYLAVYERVLPQYAADEVAALVARWRAGGIKIVTAMSVASLMNLIEVLPDSALEMLARTPLVTPAERVLKEALQQFPELPVVLSDGPDADEMVLAMIRSIARHTARG